LDKNIKISIFLLGLAAVLFGLSTNTKNLKLPKKNEADYARQFESKLVEIILDYDSLISDSVFVNHIVTKGLENDRFNEIINKPYIILVYAKDKLIFWNKNIAIPSDFLASALDIGSNWIKLDNGYYEISKSVKLASGNALTLLRLIPIHSNFNVQNNYLKNRFHKLFEIPEYFDMSLNIEEGGSPVRNPDGKVLFYLKIDQSIINGAPNYLIITLSSIAFLFFITVLYLLAVYINNRSNSWNGMVFLLITFVALRYLMLANDYPAEFYDLNIFSPQLYASSVVNRSLGDLIINIFLGFGAIYFFFTRAGNELKISKNGFRYLFTLCSYLFLFYVTISIGDLLRSFVLDSKIPFDLTEFLNLNVYSLIGLIAVAIMLAAFLLLTIKLMRIIKSLEISTKTLFSLLIIAF